MLSTVLKKHQHQGMCDASAAVSLDANHFVVASDEDSYLRVYRAHSSGGPAIKPVKIHTLLGLDKASDESELEAAAELDGVVYWISSHSRKSNGKFSPDRHQFFGTKLKWEDGELKVKQVGSAYHQLLKDFLTHGFLSEYTRESLQPEKIASLAPKELGAINIEGMCSFNGTLLVGFRNPIPDGKALLIPLRNPLSVINGDSRARFGKPIFLDLGGLGIRSIEFLPQKSCYIIVAGGHARSENFKLFEWNGIENDSPKEIEELKKFNPESVVVFRDTDRVLILNDRGSQKVEDKDGGGTCCCKDLPDDHPRKCFDSMWVSVD